ncbi:MAG: class I SAM-dependent methyltransferase [Bacteriovoracaceae bacterium]|nr:class I SAM-dependent methyltransferase [Bacteroidota bacterium]
MLRKFFVGESRRIQLSWEHTENISSNWWDIPAMTERWNTLITGSPHISYQQYATDRYLNTSKKLIGISLGCGSGDKEIEWVNQCKNLTLTGIDLSESRIRQAIKNSVLQSVNDRLKFQTGNVNDLRLPVRSLDLVIADGALHHFHHLDSLLPKIHLWLKNDGIFIINEYVGPSRFQWTDEQLRVINGLLKTMPERFRLDSDGYRKTKVYRPGRLSMMISDPSEAVESERIEPLLKQYFTVSEVKPYGGMILQNLLKGIAHHFIEGDTEAFLLLQSWCVIEDEYLRNGELRSDFMFFVCSK